MESEQSKDGQQGWPSSNSNESPATTKCSTNAHSVQDSMGNDEVVGAAPWSALFAFTTRANLPLLLSGITVSLFAGLASPATNLINGYLFEGFTDFANGSVNQDELMQRQSKYVLYLTAIAAVSWLFHSLEFMIWLAFGELQAKSARDRLFRGLLEKEIEWYDRRKNGISALLPRLAAQTRELQLATAQPLGLLFSLMATAIASLVQALIVSWDLTLVTLSTVPVFMAIVAYCGVPMQRNLVQQQEKLTEAQKYSTSALASIETVKCFNGQKIELQKYKISIDAAAIWYGWVAHASAVQMGVLAFLTFSVFIQGFYYGAILVAKGKVDSGDVITTFFSAVSAFQAISGILQQGIVFEKGRVAGMTLREIIVRIESGSVAERTQGLLAPAQCHGNIDIENLSFAYPSRPDRLAIKDVTMLIESGEMTFLIGGSGSGKSTIGQLLMRFYTSSKQGQIKIDNNPLESLETNWLRSNITLVEQQSLLFHDTAFNNIAFGRKDWSNVTRTEVMQAVEFALLQQMMNDLPDGLDTVVGFNGGSMSGGQRQRMALARARLRDTPILILDESTSALDYISRSLMMEAIRKWRKEKTTIIITHDISQVLADDYVYLLEDGCLVLEGYQKNLVQMKDMPFQAYLYSEHKGPVSPAITDTFDSINSQAPSLISRTEDFAQSSKSGDWTDPSEKQLTADEQVSNQRLYFPATLEEGSPLLRMRGFNKDGLMRFAPSFGRDSPSLVMRVTPPVDLNCRLETQSESPSSLRRWSQALKELVDETGRQAAKSRQISVGLSGHRRNFHDDTVNPLTSRDMSLGTLGSHQNGTTKLNSVKYIFGTVWPNLNRKGRILLVAGFWGATVHAIATPVFAYVLAQLLGTYNKPGGDKQKALVYSMIILAISVAEATHTWIYRFCHEYVSELWVDQLRTKAYERILDQGRGFFEKHENGVSRLIESLDRNAEDMRNLLGRFASLSYVAIVMVTVALAWAIAAQWKMALIALCVAPYIYCVTKAFAKISEKWELHSNDAAELASAIFAETFTNIKSVRAWTLEAHFVDKYVQATNQALKVGFQRSLYAGFFYGLSDSASNFSTAINFYVGSKLIADGANITDILQVFTMLVFTIGNVGTILEYIPQIGSSKDTASRLLRLVTLPRNSHEHLGDTRITTVGEIVFENLSFCYPFRPQQTILRNINLALLPGTTTAIVGGCGSGKSTIANLLLGLYSTSSPSYTTSQTGSLTFGSRDVKHIHTPSLRALIVPVSQNPTLFAATVSENIAYGLPSNSPHRTPENIALAAQQAGIHAFIISLPLGYATPLGDGGTGLSGGQAQRIALARALVRKPAVLILDEATSALDPESAGFVRRTIQELVRASQRSARPMTVLIITHDRRMMEIAEHVVVLEQGRVVEEGPFAELAGRKHGALANLLSGGEWDGEGLGLAGERAVARKTGGVPLVRDVDWKKNNKGKRKMADSGAGMNL